MLGAVETTCDAATAKALKIAKGAPVLRLDTVRSADSTPISLGVAFFPLPRFAALASAYRRANSVTKALKACGVADYRRTETRISARPATTDEARQPRPRARAPDTHGRFGERR
ncbi:MAG: UTRA domain-containing protein [Bauldia sp.]